MKSHLMTIGQISRRSRVTPRAIRHYEKLGLIRPALRSESNYRLFDADSVERLGFISRCRSLGFSIAEISDLLRLIDEPNRTCAQVKDLTAKHLTLIDEKLENLAEMRSTLAQGLSHCSGRDVPDCAVIDLLRNTA